MDEPMEKPPAVAIVDSVPTYRLGLETALAATLFDVIRPPDVRSWSRTATNAVLSVTLRSSVEKNLVADLHEERPSLAIVAILSSPDDAAYREAIVIGASSAVAWNDDTDEIVSAIQAALRCRSILPTQVMRALVLDADPQPQISNLEINWLDQLARGARVTQLADESGYSEREMHRLLRQLYSRLGADSRSAALVKAARLGLLQ